MNKILSAAYNKLHHLSMRYFGAYIEAGSGKPIGLIPLTHPGRKEVRDIVDLVLCLRAEVNALTMLLMKRDILITRAEFEKQLIEEINIVIKNKCEQLGVKVDDNGLVYEIKPNEGKNNPERN